MVGKDWFGFRLGYGLEAAADELPTEDFKVILRSRFNVEIATGSLYIHAIGIGQVITWPVGSSTIGLTS